MEGMFLAESEMTAFETETVGSCLSSLGPARTYAAPSHSSHRPACFSTGIGPERSSAAGEFDETEIDTEMLIRKLDSTFELTDKWFVFIGGVSAPTRNDCPRRGDSLRMSPGFFAECT